MKNKYFINLLLINTHSFSMQGGDVLIEPILDNPNEKRCNKFCNKLLESCNLKPIIYILCFFLFIGLICSVIFNICSAYPNSNFCNPNNVTPIY
jgi:hypothetical protein